MKRRNNTQTFEEVTNVSSNASVSFWTLLGYGLLTWIIPFVAAIPLMGPDGKPVVSHELFKSIMVVTSSLSGCYLLLKIASRKPNMGNAGVVIGLFWTVLNWILDYFILLPLNGMSLRVYFEDIGVRYLSILINAIVIFQAAKLNK